MYCCSRYLIARGVSEQKAPVFSVRTGYASKCHWTKCLLKQTGHLNTPWSVSLPWQSLDISLISIASKQGEREREKNNVQVSFKIMPSCMFLCRAYHYEEVYLCPSVFLSLSLSHFQLSLVLATGELTTIFFLLFSLP